MRNTHCALEHHQVTLLCPGASRSGHRGQSEWPLPRATSPSAHLPGPPRRAAWVWGLRPSRMWFCALFPHLLSALPTAPRSRGADPCPRAAAVPPRAPGRCAAAGACPGRPYHTFGGGGQHGGMPPCAHTRESLVLTWAWSC